jgi:hypothetical protein
MMESSSAQTAPDLPLRAAGSAFQVDFKFQQPAGSASASKSPSELLGSVRDRDASEPESQVRVRGLGSLPLRTQVTVPTITHRTWLKGASNDVCQERRQQALCVPTTGLLTSSAAPSRWPRARLLSRLRKTRQTLNHVDCCQRQSIP